MTAGVLVAITGARESELVRLLDSRGTGVRVVRRCADMPEVLAAALAGLGTVAVLSSDLDGVDRTAVARLTTAGVRTLVVAEPAEAERCRALGAFAVLDATADLAAWVGAVTAAATDEARSEGSGLPSDPDDASDLDEPPAAPPDDGGPARSVGRLVAVWGPRGAPGRTAVAVTLASELAAAGVPALLVDADTEAPSVVQALGLLEESAGIAAAARAAAHGRLDAATLARACRTVPEGFRVLAGLTRADRWRELPASSLEVLWERCREIAPWTVVDTAAGAEGGGGGFEAAYAPRRHQATLSALEAADVVVVVGAAEPVGVHRLVLALTELAERGLPRPGAERVVVANRVRGSATGARPEISVREALARFAGVESVVLVPDDRAAFDRALLTGATLRQASPGSPARAVLADLATSLSGVASPRRRGRGVRVRARD